MRRPWFSRRWIVQEIALARWATLHCGDKQVKWQDFADAISLFHSKQHEIRKLFRESTAFHNHPDYLGDVSELGATRLVEAAAHIFRKSDDNQIMEHLLSLEALMSMLSAFEASDPHDTVYAILWMAHDARPMFFGDPRNAYSPGPSPMNSPAIRAINSPPNGAFFADAILSKLDTSLPKAAAVNSYVEHTESVDSGKPLNEPRLPALSVSNGDKQAEVAMRRYSLQCDSPSNHEIDDEVNGARIKESRKRTVSMANPQSLGPRKSPNTTLRIPEPSISTRSVAARFSQSIRGKRITVDYEKSVFEVCRDFLAFTINRSHCLDMICMPWAPEAPADEPPLPSWIPRLSGKAFGLSINKAYRRVNADPLVGGPRWDGRPYNAAPKTYAAPIPPESRDRTLRVKAFAFDKIKKKYFPATAGIIPSQWLQAGGWNDTSEPPPDQFWRTLVGNRDAHRQRPPAYWMRACGDAFARRPTGGALDTKELLAYDCPAVTRSFVEKVQTHSLGAQIGSTESTSASSYGRHIGALPRPGACQMQEGGFGMHSIWVQRSCPAPEIRERETYEDSWECDCKQINCKCEQNKSNDASSRNGDSGRVAPKIHYEFVGECYVHGMMDGEAFRIQKEQKLEYETLDLE